jgi:putative transcriptional regulator
MCTGSAKQIPVDVLDKMCRVLKCQPGDLLEFIPEDPQDGA